MRIIAIILFAACGSRDAEAPSNESASTGAGTQEAPAEVAAEIPIDPAPAPQVELQGTPVEEGVALRVRVPGPASVELRRSVRVQRRNGDAWEPAGAAYALAMDCETPPGDCVTLAAGAELSAPPIGTASGQCEGSGIAPGDYRFVLESCAPDGTRAHEVDVAFTLAERR